MMPSGKAWPGHGAAGVRSRLIDLMRRQTGSEEDLAAADSQRDPLLPIPR